MVFGVWKELVWRKGRDVGGCYKMMTVKFVLIRKWFEVLWCQATRRGYVDTELCRWCARSQKVIRMVHRRTRNGSRVEDEVYIKRGYVVLEELFYVSLYSLSCIAKQVRLWTSSDLCLALISWIRTSSACPDSDITFTLLISPTPDPACCSLILRMSFNAAWINFSFASWVIYLPIGCRHPFIRYWQPSLAKIAATCSLPHSDNECQQSVNSVSSCIFGDQGIAQIFAPITEALTALKGDSAIYQW